MSQTRGEVARTHHLGPGGTEIFQLPAVRSELIAPFDVG